MDKTDLHFYIDLWKFSFLIKNLSFIYYGVSDTKI